MMRMDGCPRAGPRGVSQRRQRAVVLSRSLITECRFWGQRLRQTSQRPSQPGPQKWTISQASDVTARYASAGHVPPCRAGVEGLDGEQGDLARDTWGYKGAARALGLGCGALSHHEQPAAAKGNAGGALHPPPLLWQSGAS